MNDWLSDFAEGKAQSLWSPIFFQTYFFRQMFVRCCSDVSLCGG